jgi:heme/copper-type cytochrome/quinol oxidase subunit 3
MSTTEHLVADPEDPSVLASNIAVGARLLASAVAFLFMAFVFAFFYLRALNTNHLFRPPHTNPPSGFGVAVLVCVLASVAVFDLARRALRDGSGSPWRLGVLTAWLLGLAAVVVQAIEYFNLSFGASTGGGLGSVFLGFTAVFAFFWLGAVYWMETMWAQSLRQPPGAGGEVHAPSRVLRPTADSCAVFLYVMAVIELLAFILLYLVK